MPFMGLRTETGECMTREEIALLTPYDHRASILRPLPARDRPPRTRAHPVPRRSGRA